ncbi:MAG: tetratricopeptide repeat protein [Chloroflexota bacterium]
MARTNNDTGFERQIAQLHTISQEVPLIGRDEELRYLLNQLYHVLDESGICFTLVTGEPGIGKSRLFQAFSEWLERLPEPVQWYRVELGAQWQSIPYALWRMVCINIFQIDDTDSAATVRMKIEHGVSAVLRPNSAEKAAFIGQLLGFDFVTAPYFVDTLHDPEQVYTRARHYFAQFLAAYSAQTPLILMIEDLHWADDRSLELVDYLVTGEQHGRILLIGSSRNQLLNRRPAWKSLQDSGAHLALRPLHDSESHEFVRALLSADGEVPASLQNIVTTRAEGNPFYIEELVKMLIAERIIQPSSRAWHVRASRKTQERIPATLTDVLHARLDTCGLDEQAVLARAAVIGRSFWHGAVEYLHPFEADNIDGTTQARLRQALLHLCNRNIVVVQPTSTFVGEEEYRFKHTLLHEVLYQRISSEERQHYHGQIAEWIIAYSKERVAEYAGLIAFHYEEAGITQQAAEWYIQAGYQARDSYAPTVAIDHLRKAFTLIHDSDHSISQRIKLYEDLGTLLVDQSNQRDALHMFETMCACAESIDDAQAQARAWIGIAHTHAIQNDVEKLLTSAMQAERLARPFGNSTELASALLRKGWALVHLGYNDEALEAVEQSLHIGREMSNWYQEASALNCLGTVYEYLGQYDRSVSCMEEALIIYQQHEDRRSEAVILNNLASMANSRGDFATALPLAQKAVQITHEIGTRLVKLYALGTLGETRIGLKQYALAEASTRQGIQLSEALGQASIPELYYVLAEACLGQGKAIEALEIAHQALALAQQTKELREIGIAWRVLGQVMAQQPDNIGAEACFLESTRVFQEADLVAEYASTLREWAIYDVICGQLEQARMRQTEAYRLFEQLGLVHELVRTPLYS